jgi:replicative DNA helicase
MEMERAFLGSLLIAAGKGKADTRIKPDDFESRTYGRIYAAMLKQWAAGTTPTISTLSHDLFFNNDLPKAEKIPLPTISELTDIVSSDANLTFYENHIFEASKTRLFITALQQAKEEIDAHTDTDTVIKNLMPALAAVTTARNEAGIRSAAELLKMQFPEIRWIIKGLIGEGLTLICGAPKIGKSWFVLNLAIAAAAGGGFLGTLTAQKTDTLYLALEDT